MSYYPFPQPRILIVTYNLRGAAASYGKFYEALKAQGAWWHYLPTTWLLHTNQTSEQVFSTVRAHLLPADHIFIGTLQNGYNGWLPKDAWDWIRARGLSP